MVKIQKKTKKNKQQHYQQQDDQFNVQKEQNLDKNQGKLKKQRPMKDVFDQILAEEQTKQKTIKKNKMIKKQKKKTQIKTQENKPVEIHQKDQKIIKIDPCFKYVANKTLEDDLKSKTLNGVVKVLNLISAHKKQIGQA